MAEKKAVKYDIDGYDAVTSALMDLLNEYPALDVGEKIAFSVLGETGGIGMFPVSGSMIETEKTYITGKTAEICLYPFYIVYRASGLSEKRKESVKEWLDNLGRWLEQKEITVNEQNHKLSKLPSLTDDRKFLTITRQTPAYLDNTSEDKTEDWAIYISARYQYKYRK